MAPSTSYTGGRIIAIAAIPLLAVPIEDVPLLSYTLSHSTINQRSNTTASTDIYRGLLDYDPLTSEEQRPIHKKRLIGFGQRPTSLWLIEDVHFRVIGSKVGELWKNGTLLTVYDKL